jgi:hypothetical protein
MGALVEFIGRTVAPSVVTIGLEAGMLTVEMGVDATPAGKAQASVTNARITSAI